MEFDNALFLLTLSVCFVTFSPMILAMADPQLPDPTIHIFFWPGILSFTPSFWLDFIVQLTTCVGNSKNNMRY